MAFRVKNLMIQVLPDQGGQLQPQSAQTNPNICLPWVTLLICKIGPSFFPLPLSLLCPDSPTDPQTLVALKAQLQELLNGIEVQQKVVNEQTSLNTVEEAQALEDQLTVALKEVQQQKADLQNKAGGDQG